MDDLTDEQRRAYWRYNITLTTILLVIWFVVAYIVSGLLAGGSTSIPSSAFHWVTTWRHRGRW